VKKKPAAARESRGGKNEPGVDGGELRREDGTRFRNYQMIRGRFASRLSEKKGEEKERAKAQS